MIMGIPLRAGRRVVHAQARRYKTALPLTLMHHHAAIVKNTVPWSGTANAVNPSLVTLLALPPQMYVTFTAGQSPGFVHRHDEPHSS
jgi:hypothetical protein